MAPKRNERIQILLNDEELAAVDEWRFDNRMPSRSAAVRALVHVALKGRGKTQVKPEGAISSRDVGIIDSSPKLEAALGTGARKTVLLVEDEFLVALGLESMIEDLGFDILGPVSSTEEAMELIGKTRPDAAILDVDLGRETSFALAEHLQKSRVPLVFCTGVKVECPESLKDVPMLIKPHVQEKIDDLLRGMIS
jgi:CheY-like chemotaxis protein